MAAMRLRPVGVVGLGVLGPTWLGEGREGRWLRQVWSWCSVLGRKGGCVVWMARGRAWACAQWEVGEARNLWEVVQAGL